jgi:diguanylate cyclase (GGDEF)-like protein
MMTDARGTSTRGVIALLLAMGLIFVSALIGAVHFLTHRIDLGTRADTEAAHAQILRGWMESQVTATDDYAFWNDALEMIAEGDPDIIYDNIGAAATDALLFDDLLILSASGAVLHAFDTDGAVDTVATERLASLRPVLVRLAAAPVEDYPIVDGFLTWQGAPAFVTAARFTPYPDPSSTTTPLPVLVTVRHVGPALFDQFAMATGASGFVVTATAEPQGEALTLRAPDGAPTAWVTWVARQPGALLRADLMPGIVAFCLAMLALSLLAARYFHRQAQHLRHAQQIASTDQLTGVLNRAGLDTALRAADTKRKLAAAQFAVLTIDINEFKALNDRFGHHAGDCVLKTVATRLQAAVRPGDLVIRTGGDEFVILLLDGAPIEAANAVAHALSAAMVAPVTLGSHDIPVRLSIGVAVARPDLSWSTVLAQSDAAMYWAKRKPSPEPLAFYDAQMQAPAA